MTSPTRPSRPECGPKFTVVALIQRWRGQIEVDPTEVSRGPRRFRGLETVVEFRKLTRRRGGWVGKGSNFEPTFLPGTERGWLGSFQGDVKCPIPTWCWGRNLVSEIGGKG